MYPAIILVCTTLVTNAASGTVATKTCSPEHMPIILAAANTVKALAVQEINEVAISEVAAPKVKTVTETVKHETPKHFRVTNYIPRHWHHQSRSRIRVIPTANELPPQHKPVSFWDKLKSLPEQISKSITIE